MPATIQIQRGISTFYLPRMMIKNPLIFWLAEQLERDGGMIVPHRLYMRWLSQVNFGGFGQKDTIETCDEPAGGSYRDGHTLLGSGSDTDMGITAHELAHARVHALWPQLREAIRMRNVGLAYATTEQQRALLEVFDTIHGPQWRAFREQIAANRLYAGIDSDPVGMMDEAIGYTTGALAQKWHWLPRFGAKQISHELTYGDMERFVRAGLLPSFLLPTSLANRSENCVLEGATYWQAVATGLDHEGHLALGMAWRVLEPSTVGTVRMQKLGGTSPEAESTRQKRSSGRSNRNGILNHHRHFENPFDHRIGQGRGQRVGRTDPFGWSIPSVATPVGTRGARDWDGHHRAQMENLGLLLKRVDGKNINESAHALSQIVSQIDPDYTSAHLSRVLKYASDVLTRLKQKGVSFDETPEALLAGIALHDIGKIRTPKEILFKPGSLNDEELQIMRRHPIDGAEILRQAGASNELVKIVLYHQEKHDGSGYPEGLKGQDIPLGSRIAAVVDAFDAMTSDRPYRKGRSGTEAMEELKRCRGSQFDPIIVDIVVELFEEGNFQVGHTTEGCQLNHTTGSGKNNGNPHHHQPFDRITGERMTHTSVGGFANHSNLFDFSPLCPQSPVGTRGARDWDGKDRMKRHQAKNVIRFLTSDDLGVGRDRNFNKFFEGIQLNGTLHVFGYFSRKVLLAALLAYAGGNVFKHIELILPPDVRFDFISLDFTFAEGTIVIFMLSHLFSPLSGINPFVSMRNINRNDSDPSVRQEAADNVDRSIFSPSQNQTAWPTLIFRILFQNFTVSNRRLNIFNRNMFSRAFLLSMKTYFITFMPNRTLDGTNIHRVTETNIFELQRQARGSKNKRGQHPVFVDRKPMPYTRVGGFTHRRSNPFDWSLASTPVGTRGARDWDGHNRGFYVMKRLRNSSGEIISVFLNDKRTSKSMSHEIRTSASAASAHSRNMSSLGSRQMASRLVLTKTDFLRIKDIRLALSRWLMRLMNAGLFRVVANSLRMSSEMYNRNLSSLKALMIKRAIFDLRRPLIQTLVSMTTLTAGLFIIFLSGFFADSVYFFLRDRMLFDALVDAFEQLLELFFPCVFLQFFNELRTVFQGEFLDGLFNFLQADLTFDHSFIFLSLATITALVVNVNRGRKYSVNSNKQSFHFKVFYRRQHHQSFDKTSGERLTHTSVGGFVNHSNLFDYSPLCPQSPIGTAGARDLKDHVVGKKRIIKQEPSLEETKTRIIGLMAEVQSDMQEQIAYLVDEAQGDRKDQLWEFMSNFNTENTERLIDFCDEIKKTTEIDKVWTIADNALKEFCKKVDTCVQNQSLTKDDAKSLRFAVSVRQAELIRLKKAYQIFMRGPGDGSGPSAAKENGKEFGERIFSSDDLVRPVDLLIARIYEERSEDYKDQVRSTKDGDGFFVPSRVQNVVRILDRLDFPKGTRFLDLGSGDGRAAILAAARGLKVAAVEADGHLISSASAVERQILAQYPEVNPVEWVHGDYFDLSFRKFDVFFYFVYGTVHESFLRRKLRRESLTGSRIIIYYHHGPRYPFPGFLWLKEYREILDTATIYQKGQGGVLGNSGHAAQRSERQHHNQFGAIERHVITRTRVGGLHLRANPFADELTRGVDGQGGRADSGGIVGRIVQGEKQNNKKHHSVSVATSNDRELLEKAYQYLKGIPFIRDIRGFGIDDLELSKQLADQILNYPIRSIMVVGAGLTKFPVLMALIGKKVVFVDSNQNQMIRLRVEWQKIREILREAGASGLTIDFEINSIIAEIGVLDVKTFALENEFDLVTMVDLAGGDAIVGDVKEWFLNLRRLLKQSSYAIVDLATRKVSYQFRKIFNPMERGLLVPNPYVGVYNACERRNGSSYFYQINMMPKKKPECARMEKPVKVGFGRGRSREGLPHHRPYNPTTGERVTRTRIGGFTNHSNLFEWSARPVGTRGVKDWDRFNRGQRPNIEISDQFIRDRKLYPINVEMELHQAQPLAPMDQNLSILTKQLKAVHQRLLTSSRGMTREEVFLWIQGRDRGIDVQLINDICILSISNFLKRKIIDHLTLLGLSKMRIKEILDPIYNTTVCLVIEDIYDYDPQLGALTTFSFYRVVQGIAEHFRNEFSTAFPLDSDFRRKLYSILTAREKIMREHATADEPRIEEIFNETGRQWSQKEIERILRAWKRGDFADTLSIEGMRKNDGDAYEAFFKDHTFNPADRVGQKDARRLIWAPFLKMSKRLALSLLIHFDGERQNQKSPGHFVDIGYIFGVTKENARQCVLAARIYYLELYEETIEEDMAVTDEDLEEIEELKELRIKAFRLIELNVACFLSEIILGFEKEFKRLPTVEEVSMKLDASSMAHQLIADALYFRTLWKNDVGEDISVREYMKKAKAQSAGSLGVLKRTRKEPRHHASFYTESGERVTHTSVGGFANYSNLFDFSPLCPQSPIGTRGAKDLKGERKNKKRSSIVEIDLSGYGVKGASLRLHRWLPFHQAPAELKEILRAIPFSIEVFYGRSIGGLNGIQTETSISVETIGIDIVGRGIGTAVYRWLSEQAKANDQTIYHETASAGVLRALQKAGLDITIDERIVVRAQDEDIRNHPVVGARIKSGEAMNVVAVLSERARLPRGHSKGNRRKHQHHQSFDLGTGDRINRYAGFTHRRSNPFDYSLEKSVGTVGADGIDGKSPEGMIGKIEESDPLGLEKQKTRTEKTKRPIDLKELMSFYLEAKKESSRKALDRTAQHFGITSEEVIKSLIRWLALTLIEPTAKNIAAILGMHRSIVGQYLSVLLKNQGRTSLARNAKVIRHFLEHPNMSLRERKKFLGINRTKVFRDQEAVESVIARIIAALKEEHLDKEQLGLDLNTTLEIVDEVIVLAKLNYKSDKNGGASDELTPGEDSDISDVSEKEDVLNDQRFDREELDSGKVSEAFDEFARVARAFGLNPTAAQVEMAQILLKREGRVPHLIAFAVELDLGTR